MRKSIHPDVQGGIRNTISGIASRCDSYLLEQVSTMHALKPGVVLVRTRTCSGHLLTSAAGVNCMVARCSLACSAIADMTAASTPSSCNCLMPLSTSNTSAADACMLANITWND